MGIKGLLPLLNPITKEMHIQEYAGKTVAVDGHCWLHRGAFGCAYELAMNMNTAKYVNYFMEMVQMLLFFNVTPLIVFDGMHLPMKEYTTTKRLFDRQDALDEGRHHARNGLPQNAQKSFQKAVVISENMIYTVIEELKKINVKYVIAPYEADPQLTYLVNKGIADAAISEDSDLLTFGCKKVIYKLGRNGQAGQIAYDDIFKSKQLQMTKFTPQMFRYMCILSGCDYLPTLSKSTNSVKKARGILQRHPTIDDFVKTLYFFSHKDIVDPYLENFFKADAAFLYQYVFNMNSRTYTRLNPVPSDVDPEDISLLGEDPNNEHIRLLRANKSIVRPSAAYLESIKENINPLFNDDNDAEFDELKFDDTTLKQVEEILEKVDHTVQSTKATVANPIHSAGSVVENANATMVNFISSAGCSLRNAKEIKSTSLREAKKAAKASIFSNHTGRKPVASPFKVYVDNTEPARSSKPTTLGDRTNNLAPAQKNKSTPTHSTIHHHIHHTSLFGKPVASKPSLDTNLKAYNNNTLAGKTLASNSSLDTNLKTSNNNTLAGETTSKYVHNEKPPTEPTVIVIDDDDDNDGSTVNPIANQRLHYNNLHQYKKHISSKNTNHSRITANARVNQSNKRLPNGIPMKITAESFILPETSNIKPAHNISGLTSKRLLNGVARPRQCTAEEFLLPKPKSNKLLSNGSSSTYNNKRLSDGVAQPIQTTVKSTTVFETSTTTRKRKYDTSDHVLNKKRITKIY